MIIRLLAKLHVFTKLSARMRPKHYEMQSQPLKSIFLSAVAAVNPDKLIENVVKLNGNVLAINDRRYELKKPCYVVGFGKAVLNMAIALERSLGENLKKGICTIPEGSLKGLSLNSRIRFIEGASDNLPDENAMEGAVQIKNLVTKLDVDDFVIILISGGGSALLPLPKEPVTLEEKLKVIKLLSSRGADIIELNSIRKSLSQLKGGGLAEYVYPAKAACLILSDVIGDPLEYIASGPTVPNRDGLKASFDILNKYSLTEEVPESVRKILIDNPNLSDSKSVPVDGSGRFTHVDNFIVGNNFVASRAALEKAKELGYSSAILSTKIRGEVSDLALIYSEFASYILDAMGNRCNSKLKKFLLGNMYRLEASQDEINEVLGLDFSNEKGVCIILAGEPTVRVVGKGKGGRNQELALRFSLAIDHLDVQGNCISFISCGTDGIDGPTDAAGAIGFSGLASKAKSEGIDPENYTQNNDSYTFYTNFDNGKYLVKTGHTGTNVMDIHILMISSKCKCNESTIN